MGYVRLRLVLFSISMMLVVVTWSGLTGRVARAWDEPTAGSERQVAREQDDKEPDAAKPNGNVPDGPVPVRESNCVRCHLTAGRELTEAVHVFAHSVHDRIADISCDDCHGGNTEDDARAHEETFGFIGTKMSAHLKKCQECHEEQGETLAAGPHFWDHQKRLSIKYPLCVDCHGNHDVGNPPAEFSMSLVCMDCHRNFARKMPAYAKVTEAYDAMWQSILAWRSANPEAEDRVPEELDSQLAEIRTRTGEVFHASGTLDPAEAERLAGKMGALKSALDKTLAAGGE